MCGARLPREAVRRRALDEALGKDVYDAAEGQPGVSPGHRTRNEAPFRSSRRNGGGLEWYGGLWSRK